MVRRFEDRVFLLLVVAATVLFLWLVATFFDAILWALVVLPEELGPATSTARAPRSTTPSAIEA